MARFSLFGANTFGGAAVASTGTTRGFEFEVTAACSFAGYRYWRNVTGANAMVGTQTHVGYLWAVASGPELTAARVTFTTANDPVTEGWKEQTLATPVALTVGARYRAVIVFPTNHPQQSPFWTADMASGPIKGLSSANATGGTQGKNGSGPTVYPNTGSGSQAHYGVDVFVDTVDAVAKRTAAFLPFFGA